MFASSHAYLILCSLYFVVWCIFFYLRKDLRKELCIITLLATPLGLTEWLYYDYFRPDFLFPLLPRIGFEDFLWAGLVSGVAAVSYELLARRRSYRVRKLVPGWMGNLWLSIVIVSGVLILFFGTQKFSMNSAYVSIIGFIAIALMIVWWRRDLLRDALGSGAILASITFCVYFVWLFLYPEAFNSYWQLHNISGISFAGIPVEELIYSFAWGMVVGPMYEVMEGLRLRKFVKVTALNKIR